MPEVASNPHTPPSLRMVPPFPAVAQRVLAAISQEDVNVQEVSNVVKMDPAFSAELLRFANSAMFGARREVKTLAQAIIVIGMDRVKAVATLAAANQMVRAAVRIESLRKVWVHSLATALVAEEIARATHLPRDSAYTLGLLHNLGALALMSTFPQKYAKLLEGANNPGFDLMKAEEELFEIDHCAAGAHLARKWNFPEQVAAAIATHHGLPDLDKHTLENLIQVSWRFSDTLGFALCPPERVWTYQELLDFVPNPEDSWLGSSTEEARAEINRRLAGSPV